MFRTPNQPVNRGVDVQQVIALRLAQFKFDPARADGARETTVLIAVIDRQLKTFIRDRVRQTNRISGRFREPPRRGLREGAPSAGQDEERSRSRPEEPNEPAARPEPVDLRLDIAEVLDRLTPRQRAICLHLAAGRSQVETAAILNCDRQTVGREMVVIRRRFASRGVKAD